MEVKKHEMLEQKMCKELDMLEEKMRTGGEMSIQDLDKIDKLYHALKSMATYNAMKEAEEYGYSEDGMSGRRGRDASTGRYISRDDGRSYTDGYSRGYSEAMNQMNNSGHYPPMPDYTPRRW
jgi:hypothetical protein